jgi:hypothetical protein
MVSWHRCHRGWSGKRRPQPRRDLLWAPLQLKLALHVLTQLGVDQQPATARPPSPLTSPRVRQIAVITTVVCCHVAA